MSLVLAGCGPSESDVPASTSMADTLWSHRTPYVGDNSRMASLVDAAVFGPKGTYSIALQTTKRAYGVTVTFQEFDKPLADVDFVENVTLVLGLAENLDRVSVTSGRQTSSLTAADASAQLGFDVKTLAMDKTKLAAYVKSNDD